MKGRYQNRIEPPQGTLDLLIPQTLRWGSRYGYSISQAIRTSSGEVPQIDTLLALPGAAPAGTTEMDQLGMGSL